MGIDPLAWWGEQPVTHDRPDPQRGTVHAQERTNVDARTTRWQENRGEISHQRLANAQHIDRDLAEAAEGPRSQRLATEVLRERL